MFICSNMNIDRLKSDLKNAAVELNTTELAYREAKQRYDQLFDEISKLSRESSFDSIEPQNKKDIILELLKSEDREFSVSEIVEKTSISPTTVRSLLSFLKLKNQIVNSSTKKGFWKFKQFAELDNPITHM